MQEKETFPPINTTLPRSYIVMDIETASELKDEVYEHWKLAHKLDKRLKDPDKIAENYAALRSKFGLSPTTGKIILIGLLTNIPLANSVEHKDDNGQSHYHLALTGKESDILENFINIMENNYSAILVTYNGLEFDLPFIRIRCMINNIRSRSLGTYMSKYNNHYHTDIYSVLGNYNMTFPLRELAYLCNISTDLSSTGADVEQMWNDDKLNLIIEYNEMQLWQTLKLYQRMNKA